MPHTRPSRWLIFILPLAPLLAGGCVFDKIHEELVTINDNMKVTQGLLKQANGTLDEVHAQLDEVKETNELLVSLQAGLGTDDAGQAQSKNRASIISTMESIDRSLAKMDEHMSILRKTIANIDSTIPFLKISAEPDEPEAPEAPADAETNSTGVASVPDMPTEPKSAPPSDQPAATPPDAPRK